MNMSKEVLYEDVSKMKATVGEVMDGHGGRSILSTPPNWITKTLRNEDMVSKDEDASKLVLRHKRMEAASRLGGRSWASASFKESDVSSRRIDLKSGVSTDRSIEEEHRIARNSLQNVIECFPFDSEHYQENLFLEMGFSPALIQRAILLHGAQADDSIIMQYLLDFRDSNDVLETANQKNDVHSKFKFPNYNEIKIAGEHVSGLLAVHQQMENNGGEQLWSSEDSDFTDSDLDDADEASPSKPGPLTKWTVARGTYYPVSLCGRKPLTGEGKRPSISNRGFAAELVKRAIQELGEGVDYDMLLEYLLYITAQQDPKSSTSALRVERASTAKKLMNNRRNPAKQQTRFKEQSSTVERLVKKCGYEANIVERAMVICGTPLWNAKQDQMVGLVDFLAAHGAGLNKLVDTVQFDEDPRRDSGWCWLGQHQEESASRSIGIKRKLGCSGAAGKRSIVPLSRPPNFEQEQHDHPHLSLALNLKRENSSRLSLSRKQSLSCMVEGMLVPSQRRDTAVGRVGKSRMALTVDRHDGSVGFGLPDNPVQFRYLNEDVKGAPYFYFENVASVPNDEWDRIRRHLFDIEPEFVDSLHFSPCRRPRGYIHNLPIEGRRKIIADPPMTIQELLPHTKRFWPAWDPRTKLNCITTRMGSEFLIKKLHIGDGTALQTADPSPEQQREILRLCRHWNLVWTAPNIPTPIDEIEIEAMLGFDAGHSRNILSNRSRYKALGNSFSIYTVAFHFSVLKPLYPEGVKVLSLFSGIGGAEVALHKMGIKLLVVVSVDVDDGTHRCLEAWWATSKQAGVLNQNYRNIKDLGRAQITELVNMYGGFDLIVGGTPCNNLSGSNHVTRFGLDGKQSSIFFEFSRVVAAVRELTIRLQHQ